MADVVLPGYRFATVTPDDRRGLIYIAAFLALVYSNLTFFARCFIKWRVLGLDDWTVCIAQVTYFVHFAYLIVSLSAGLGKTFGLLSEDEYMRMASSQYANQIALYISLGLSKCAAMLLVQRLFTRDTKKYWLICSGVTGLMVVWTVVAALLVSVGCSPESLAPPSAASVCSGISERYEVVVITDIVTDILLVLAPAYLVWQLQMHISLKMQVATVFAIRLPLIPLSILAFTRWTASLQSANPGVDRASAILYQQSQLCFSLMAATVPCLKSFIRSFDTGSGVKVAYGTNGYGSSGYGRGESHRMQSLNSNRSALQSDDREPGDFKVNPKPFTSESLRGGPITNSMALVYSSQEPIEEDAASHGSQELIIRRDVKWEVHSERMR